MYVAKQTIMYKRQVPEGQAYVFYIDIRSAGKGHEEFVQQAMEQYDVLYLRGKVSKVFQENGRVVVWGADTLTGKSLEVAADLVVLATATVPSQGAKDLGQRLRIATDEHGFFSEAHPKLRPDNLRWEGPQGGCLGAVRRLPRPRAAHALLFQGLLYVRGQADHYVQAPGA